MRIGVAALALAGALLCASTASAQYSSYPDCDKTPSSDDVEAAKGMHKAAEQYYAKARYDRAIESWQDAYSFDCTAHRLLINIGNAYEKLGKTEKAIEAFEVYIARMGDAADQTIVDKVANLREVLKKQGGNEPDPDPVDPTPDPVPDPDVIDEEGDVGPGPWILLGGGAAAAIVGGVLLGVGVSKEQEAIDACGEERTCTDPHFKELGNEGLDLQIAGGTVMAVGLVAVAGGVIWYLVGSSLSESAKAPVRIDVAAGPRFTGLSATGSF